MTRCQETEEPGWLSRELKKCTVGSRPLDIHTAAWGQPAASGPGDRRRRSKEGLGSAREVQHSVGGPHTASLTLTYPHQGLFLVQTNQVTRPAPAFIVPRVPLESRKKTKLLCPLQLCTAGQKACLLHHCMCPCGGCTSELRWRGALRRALTYLCGYSRGATWLALSQEGQSVDT